jgi:hypothetical protein
MTDRKFVPNHNNVLLNDPPSYKAPWQRDEQDWAVEQSAKRGHDKVVEAFEEAFQKMTIPDQDVVNAPQHYMLFPDGTEVIDVIKAVLTPEEFLGYCKGNALKYRLRAGKKDNLEQDIAKAQKFYDFMLQFLGAEVLDRR